MVSIKNKPTTLNVQASGLRNFYPSGKIISIQPFLIWEVYLKPTPISENYKCQITYDLKRAPKVFVKNSLLVENDLRNLPHVYSQEKKQLCLFYPADKSWNHNKLIAKTIVPWTAEWLFHFEIWRETDCWNGGGVHEVKPQLKVA